ncbi:hypothetical protein BRW64_06885 [Mycolicibacterium diernhoferi]|uniref:Non-haem dioxygenase N-terminal domain-containing protein n=1 Tax=Mycolicibacterium diernhoferi TaxID=1801 RepID=A0A1Q4HHG8_9MYCO|nr:hypothetical protein BRW64_06885 [Mycolicibacterium diernhoferi]OPE53541.1 hypothetical protein BV510_15005 [Mycolicibacterium diernhoferi]
MGVRLLIAFSLSVTMATVTVRGQDRGVVSVQTAPPVVDLRDEPAMLRQRLGRGAHEVGFFHLTGHDVPEELVSRVLDASRRFFALPQAAKDAIAMVNSPHLRGHTRLGGELTGGAVDWREQIDLGPERVRVSTRRCRCCACPPSSRRGPAG